MAAKAHSPLPQTAARTCDVDRSSLSSQVCVSEDIPGLNHRDDLEIVAPSNTKGVAEEEKVSQSPDIQPDWEPTHGGKRKPFLLKLRCSVYFMMFTVVSEIFLTKEAVACPSDCTARLHRSFWDCSTIWLFT